MHPEEEAVPNLEISEKVGSTGYVGCLELPGGATVKWINWWLMDN